MTTRPLPDNFADCAAWLVQALDPRARLARLVGMDDASYQEASFLDDRMMTPGVESLLVPLEPLLASTPAADGSRGGWIFHIGHVGSTLISRLLGEIPEVLAIREPRSLRDLLFFDDQERASVAAWLGRAMMRPLGTRSVPIVKATSFVSEWAPLLVRDSEPVLFLTATPESYISTILAGPNSLAELQGLRSLREQRLAGRDIRFQDWPDDQAHLAAMAWACEATSLEYAAEMMSAQARFQDFDVALNDMTAALVQIGKHFDLSLSEDTASALANGPLMSRYSKALEYDYSPSLRTELKAAARLEHGAAISEALGRLNDAAAGSPLLQRALGRSTKG